MTEEKHETQPIVKSSLGFVSEENDEGEDVSYDHCKDFGIKNNEKEEQDKGDALDDLDKYEFISSTAKISTVIVPKNLDGRRYKNPTELVN